MDSDIKKSLAIFNTDIDRYGNDSFGKEPNFERFLRIMHREQNTTHKMKFFVS